MVINFFQTQWCLARAVLTTACHNLVPETRSASKPTATRAFQSKATLWMKALHEGALATLFIVRKIPQDRAALRRGARGRDGSATLSG